MRVHLAGEHALELELLDLLGQPLHVVFDFRGCGIVGLRGGQLQEFGGIAQGSPEPVQTADHLFQLGAFLAEFLGALRVVPDARLLEFALYFLKTLVFIVVIKDTSSKSRCAPRDL